MTGHPREIVVVAAAEAHRPGERRGGGLGQVAQEPQPRLFGRVLVVKLLDQIAAPLDVRTQPRGVLAQRISVVATAYLDVQQSQARPSGRDPHRRRVHADRQPADHDRPQPGLQVHRAAALDASAVPEDSHGHDGRVNAGSRHHQLPPIAAGTPIVPHRIGQRR